MRTAYYSGSKHLKKLYLRGKQRTLPGVYHSRARTRAVSAATSPHPSSGPAIPKTIGEVAVARPLP